MTKKATYNSINTYYRRYDIDWLRVITIGLLLIYHAAIVFQPWGIFIGFFQSRQSIESIWPAMALLNVWRIPILFYISGMGLYFAMQKRNVKSLLIERTKRILVPLLFGALFIVPIHIYLWKSYYNQPASMWFNMAHLWFLANIFSYVLLLIPLLNYLNKNKNCAFNNLVKNLFKSPFGLIGISILFIAEVWVFKPDIFELYAITWHGYALGFLAFFWGFLFALHGERFWHTVKKWKVLFLSLAVTLFVIRYVVFELKAPNYLASIESTNWILAVFGYGFSYLNKANKVLHYLSQAAYPIYIIHMVFLYWGSSVILPLNISVCLKLLLVLFFTFSGCFLSYHFIIRRIKYLRPLFGLRRQTNKISK